MPAHDGVLTGTMSPARRCGLVQRAGMARRRVVAGPGRLSHGAGRASVDKQSRYREGHEDDEGQPDDRPEQEKQWERRAIVSTVARRQVFAFQRYLHDLPGLAAQVGATRNGFAWTVPSPHLGLPYARER